MSPSPYLSYADAHALGMRWPVSAIRAGMLVQPRVAGSAASGRVLWVEGSTLRIRNCFAECDVPAREMWADFRSASTRGEALEAIREKWGHPDAHCTPLYNRYKMVESWRCWVRPETLQANRRAVAGANESEALVNAFLEAA